MSYKPVPSVVWKSGNKWYRAFYAFESEENDEFGGDCPTDSIITYREDQFSFVFSSQSRERVVAVQPVGPFEDVPVDDVDRVKVLDEMASGIEVLRR